MTWHRSNPRIEGQRPGNTSAPRDPLPKAMLTEISARERARVEASRRANRAYGTLDLDGWSDTMADGTAAIVPRGRPQR
jgi:hypothetical protein